MSTPAQAVAATIAPRALEVVVRGKVVASRRHEGKTYTLVVCPAANEYSSPQRLEIRSSQRFGEKDEVVNVKCRIGGYEGAPFKATDKDTGEIRQARRVVHTLDLIE